MMQWLIFLALVLTSTLISGQIITRTGDKQSDGTIQAKRELSRSSSFPDFQVKEDSFQKSFVNFQNQVMQDLGIIKKSLFLTHNANVLEKRLENCATSLLNGNENNARKFWTALRPELLTQEEVYSMGWKVISKLEYNNRTTIKATLSFLGYIEYPEGFQILLDKIKLNNLMYNGSDIFMLAHLYRQLCGISPRGIFPSLPYIVQDVISSAVQIKNVLNRGYLYNNGTGPSNVMTARSRTTPGTSSSLWVFNLTSNGGFTIANTKYKNKTQLLDDQTEFLLHLVDDETFRIQVVKSDNYPDILGKFLGGRVRTGNDVGSQNDFSPVEFFQDDYQPFEAMKWMVEDSLGLDNDKSKHKNC